MYGIPQSVYVAQLGTLPFILYYFGSFPTYFLLANLVVVILAGVILVLTFAALCLASVPIVGNTVITLLEWSTLILNESMQGVQQLAGSQITSVYLSSPQACLLAGVIFAFIFAGHPEYTARLPTGFVYWRFVICLWRCLVWNMQEKLRNSCISSVRKSTPVRKTVSPPIVLKRGCCVFEICILQC